MNTSDYSEIGQRIKILRKRKGLNQTELASLLDKSLRTVQKYETGEIEVSIAVVNHLAELLDTTPTFILGYEVNREPIHNMADIMNFLFQLETIQGVDFRIDVKKPPRNQQWECSLTFDGKSKADFNADLCLFMEQWEEERESLRTFASSQATYRKWQAETLAYYAPNKLTCETPENMDDETLRQKRLAYMQEKYGSKE